MSDTTEQTSQEQFSFIETERAIQKRWKERGIFKKSLEQTKAKAPYIFYDGPPFATGLPHPGPIFHHERLLRGSPLWLGLSRFTN